MTCPHTNVRRVKDGEGDDTTPGLWREFYYWECVDCGEEVDEPADLPEPDHSNYDFGGRL